jgi:hypothetical protein
LPDKHPPEFHQSTEVEYGLQLPNGTAIWPPDLFHGTGLTTPEERASIVEALKAASVNLGKDVDLFLAEYQWLVRHRNFYVTITWDDAYPADMIHPGIIAETPVTPVGNDTEDFVAEDQRGPTPEYYLPENNYVSDGTIDGESVTPSN